MIGQIAKLMGLEVRDVACDGTALVTIEENSWGQTEEWFNPLKDWNDTMNMEAKLRELNRWDYYVLALMEENGTVQILEDGRPEVHCSAGYLLASTQEQRCRAALKAVSDD